MRETFLGRRANVRVDIWLTCRLLQLHTRPFVSNMSTSSVDHVREAYIALPVHVSRSFYQNLRSIQEDPCTRTGKHVLETFRIYSMRESLNFIVDIVHDIKFCNYHKITNYLLTLNEVFIKSSQCLCSISITEAHDNVSSNQQQYFSCCV